VPAVKVRNLDSEADLANLVSLNCSGISAWRHYDREARPGAPARWSELSRWERWQHGGPWFDSKLLAFHLGVVKEAGGIVFVAWEGESLVGELELVFGFDGPEGSRAHIAWMTVDPGRRRQGVGSLLLRYGRRVARDRGCHRIATCPEDQTTQAFYETKGFRTTTRIAEFTKQLAKSSKHASSDSLQAIPLTWDSRPRPPDGFRLVIGDDQSPRYTWTSLRQMRTLYGLLELEAPLPNAWLLRLDEAEAITVDYEHVRLWLSPQGIKTPNFPRTTLQRTEQLSRANAVSRLTAAAFSSEFPLLRAEGYTLQKEYPYLTLPL
jgi:GNAT superfamily N-acetyltransferase